MAAPLNLALPRRRCEPGVVSAPRWQPSAFSSQRGIVHPAPVPSLVNEFDNGHATHLIG